MNNLSGIIERELLLENSTANILFTHTDNKKLDHLLKKLNHNILHYDDLYFAKSVPNIIICNDRIISYEKVGLLSIQYHIPVIMVDHEPLSSLIDKSKTDLLNNMPNSYKIAINHDIYESWGKTHDQILSTAESEIHLWNKLIYEISKRVFTL